MPLAAQPAKLWGGRFTAEPSADMDRLNQSLPIDRRLWREDITGSQAWAAALGRAGVLSTGEADLLVEGLERVAARLATWPVHEWNDASDEDIHSLVERLLRVEVGAAAGKLHTGRSRNDQVATDTRLWGLGAVDRLDVFIRDVISALVSCAEANVDTVMPSYTHLQRAQPVVAAHWALAHAWAISRDRDRLRDARPRVGVMPLGSGAIAGCPFPVDREALREELGFTTISPNSIDAVGDRDWIAELLFVSASLGVHLSRLAEDVILFSSAEFGFVRLSDQYSTGSSLMPQKRNPDAMELARGKSGRLIGGLMLMLTVLKGLPTGYNKDLQEDKEALFDAVDTLETMLPAVAGTIRTLRFNAPRAAAAIDPSMLATDIAEFLVRGGVPFREAHEMVGRLVRAAEEAGCSLAELPRDSFLAVSPVFESAELTKLFDPAQAVQARASVGGTSPESVRAQINALKLQLTAS
ncbi:MAG: argininosuccinate lyase [Gemmatimonadota bacterium]|nr:argininosuccinate lyase [Gemmatimonadota bacterium]